tara:strand:- start:476 stop:1045 length:570 start_codon:yes stop_codon:yes gene_type:complete
LEKAVKMNTEEENEALRARAAIAIKEEDEYLKAAEAQEANDRAAFDSGEEKYKLIAACEYGEHCLEIVPPPRTARLVYLTEEESDAAIKSGKITAHTMPSGKHIDATVNDDLEKFQRLADNLFSHVYSMGRDLGMGNRDRRLEQHELVAALDKTQQLRQGMAKDIMEKRGDFVELCWRILSWGNFESAK